MDPAAQFFTDALKVAPFIFQHDILRYVIGATGVFLVVNTALAPLLAGRRIRAERPPARQAIREFIVSLRTALIFGSTGMTIWALERAGAITFLDDPWHSGWAYFVLNLTVLIVLHDAWFYWTHRLIHHPKLFRRFHRTHHRSHNPTPFTSYSFDIGEAVLNAAFFPLALMLMPTSGFAGFIWAVHMMLRNAIGHCGYEIFPRTRSGRPLFDWMTTVTHHDLHHSQAGWNYGLYFTWWDRWMGTEYPTYHEAFAKAVRMSRDPAQNGRQGRVREVLATIAISAITLSGVASAFAPRAYAETTAPIAAIEGDWATEGYGAVVRMGRCPEAPEQLCGDLIWVWNEDDVEDGALGARMLRGFQFRDGVWKRGRLDNPDDGRTYRGEIAQSSADVLELKGCAVIFCRSQTWRRLSSLPHASL